jgi:hypothetical protein
MYKKIIGEKDPKICIIGSIHGDEPCGAYAIQHIISKNYDFEKPVKFIIANQKALQKDTRYIDSDLNRNFSNDKLSGYEVSLANKIEKEIKKCNNILSLHSTRSTSTPFVLSGDKNKNIFSSLPMKNIAIKKDKGSLISNYDSIEIECGYQKSKQAKINAIRFIKHYLQNHNVYNFNLSSIKTDNQIFEIVEKVKKDNKLIFLGQNFKKVDQNSIYAYNPNTGKKYRSKDSFYPILMSTNGYKNILGYKAIKL